MSNTDSNPWSKPETLDGKSSEEGLSVKDGILLLGCTGWWIWATIYSFMTTTFLVAVVISVIIFFVSFVILGNFLDPANEETTRKIKDKEKRYEEAARIVEDPNTFWDKITGKQKRQALLDQSSHEEPVEYKVYGLHPQQTLALRYGIEIYDDYVNIRKIKEVDDNLFLAELYNYSSDSNKTLKVIVAHHVGKNEDFIRSFLPIDYKTKTVDNEWFVRNRKLENVLKDNKHMSLDKIVHYYLTLAKVK